MLGMYDMPALHGPNDRLWAGVRHHLGYGPKTLNRTDDVWDIWQSDDLILAQTCGMPFRTRLKGKVGLVGTPDYGLPGCPPGYYRSVLVVRADSPGSSLSECCQGIFAFNDSLSQSGWAAPMIHLRQAGLVHETFLETGSHAASAQAVATGAANMAGIDALTWALLCEHSEVTQSLRVIAQTEPTPGLPFITAKGRDTALLADATRAAIRDLAESDRRMLHIRDLIQIPAQAYFSIPTPPAP